MLCVCVCVCRYTVRYNVNAIDDGAVFTCQADNQLGPTTHDAITLSVQCELRPPSPLSFSLHTRPYQPVYLLTFQAVFQFI